MPTFVYKAKKGLHEVFNGTIEADDRNAAVTKLSEQGLVAVSVELNSVARKSSLAAKTIKIKKLGLKELLVFTQQLKTLIRSKVELLSSLNILYKQADNPALKQVILDLHNTVKDGKTFSEGLSKYPAFFPQLYVNIIKAGEASGRLDEVLAQISGFLQEERDLKMKVTTALAYPAMMILVGVGTIFVLFSFVIPRLVGIFEDFQSILPLPTRILLAISNFMQAWWWAIIVLGILSFFLYRRQKGVAAGRAIDFFKTRIPLFGELIRKQAIARFAHTLGLLLHSGIPVHQALEIATPTLENKVFIQQLKPVYKDVLSGSTLAGSLKKVSFIPAFIIQMITVGEEGGRLEEVLAEITSAYNQETDTILKVVTSLLEPLVILCLGLVLGLIIMGMLLPIFQINMLVR